MSYSAEWGGGRFCFLSPEIYLQEGTKLIFIPSVDFYNFCRLLSLSSSSRLLKFAIQCAIVEVHYICTLKTANFAPEFGVDHSSDTQHLNHGCKYISKWSV